MSVITTPAQIAEQVARQVARDGRKDVSGTLFRSALALATLASVLSLGVLLVVMVVDGWSVLTGRLGQFLGSGFFVRAIVPHQLNTYHETLSSNITDQRVHFLKFLELVDQINADFIDFREQVLVQNELDDSFGCCSGNRIPTKC